MGIYSLLLAINNKKKIYWILIPIFLGLAFLSKQVPAAYIILSTSFVLVFYSLKNKKFEYLKYCFVSSIAFIIFILIFGNFQGIKISSFIDQYILYPQTIGAERFENFNFTFRGVIGHFKFIYLSLIPILFIYIKKNIGRKRQAYDDENFSLLILILFTFSLILHQLLTKNQTFIFFLIPLLTAFSHISLNNIKFKFKRLSYIVIIFICVFAAIKYHLRFNEGRKFHEMSHVNFDLAVKAEKIDKKLSRLNWITPEFSEKPNEEVMIINEIKTYLNDDNRIKMLITNYKFFSAILDEKLFSPSWAFTDDGTTHPVKNNKYTKEYRDLMIKIIKKK